MARRRLLEMTGREIALMFGTAGFCLLVLPFFVLVSLIVAADRKALPVSVAAAINAIAAFAAPALAYGAEKELEHLFAWNLNAVARTPIYIFIVFSGGFMSLFWSLSFWTFLARCAPSKLRKNDRVVAGSDRQPN